jgi:chromosome segregation ATPase
LVESIRSQISQQEQAMRSPITNAVDILHSLSNSMHSDVRAWVDNLIAMELRCARLAQQQHQHSISSTTDTTESARHQLLINDLNNQLQTLKVAHDGAVANVDRLSQKLKTEREKQYAKLKSVAVECAKEIDRVVDELQQGSGAQSTAAAATAASHPNILPTQSAVAGTHNDTQVRQLVSAKVRRERERIAREAAKEIDQIAAEISNKEKEVHVKETEAFVRGGIESILRECGLHQPSAPHQVSNYTRALYLLHFSFLLLWEGGGICNQLFFFFSLFSCFPFSLPQATFEFLKNEISLLQHQTQALGSSTGDESLAAMEQLSAEIDHLRASLDEANTIIAKLKLAPASMMAKAHGREFDLEDKVKELEQKLALHQAQAQALSSSVAEAKQLDEIQQLTAEKASLEERVQMLQTELSRTQQNHVVLTSNFANLQERSRAHIYLLEEQITQLSATANRAYTSVGDESPAKSGSGAEVAKIANLEQTLSRVRDECSLAQVECGSLREQCDDLRVEMTAWTELAHSHQHRIEMLTTECERLKSALKEVRLCTIWIVRRLLILLLFFVLDSEI